MCKTGQDRRQLLAKGLLLAGAAALINTRGWPAIRPIGLEHGARTVIDPAAITQGDAAVLVDTHKASTQAFATLVDLAVGALQVAVLLE